MKLSTKGRYAVMAMVDIANNSPGQPVSLVEISGRQTLPVQYLEQLFAKLRRGGLVESIRGPSGGYKLKQSANMIRISDIMLAVDEPIKATRCQPKSKLGCQGRTEKCLTHHLWEGLGQHILSYLSSMTLEDVCQQRITPRERSHIDPPHI